MKWYPPRPEGVSESVVLPSESFQSEIQKVLGGIFLFLATYIVLILGAIAFALLLCFVAYLLVVAFPRLITLVIALALALSGLMIIYFLIKFIFAKKSVDRSHLIEVKRKNEPKLFEFIDKVNEETGSPKPKKIFLSNEVNAYVFYDSHFWSMFFPTKKNLTIGLGLVNSVNLSEFKAIMAHEFGHFSQKSMRWGSYVYNVNQVIYNMLYENDGFEESVKNIGRESWYFGITTSITLSVVRFIQWILRGVYQIINKSYMALSRQMEFHADSIAAYVTGGNHLITSLRRIDIAGMCFGKVLENNRNWLGENLKADNIYEQHTEVMRHFAKDNEIDFLHDRLQVGEHTKLDWEVSKVTIENQWASHPTFEQRAAHLNSLNLKTVAVEESAWSLFQFPEMIQQDFTDKLYKEAKFEGQVTEMDLEAFKERYYLDFKANIFPEAYLGFYDLSFPLEVDLDEIMKDDAIELKSFEEIFIKSEIKQLNQLQFLFQDRDTVKAITTNELKVKTFDYDGQKYTRKEAFKVLDMLQIQIEKQSNLTTQKDKEALKYFYTLAKQANEGTQYWQLFQRAKTILKDGESVNSIYRELAGHIEGFFQEHSSLKVIDRINNEVKKAEQPFRKKLQQFLDDNQTLEFITKEGEEAIHKYLEKEHDYFIMSQEQFNSAALDHLIALINIFIGWAEQRAFKAKKEFLDYQITLK